MTRYTVHVPLQRNDGSPVELDILNLIESDLLDIAGGFTTTAATGAWRGDDTTYREPVRLYLADTSDPDALDRIIGLGRDIAGWLDQEAVYVTATELTTLLLTR